MANVQGTFYSATTQRRGVTPVSPPNAVDDPQDPLEPVNPISFLSLTDTPSTYVGQALKGVRVNSGSTALEFYTIPTVDVLGTVLTGYTVGTNTALANTDTILGAFQKVQGQINARVSGSGTVNRVAKFTASGAVGNSQIFDDGTNVLIAATTAIDTTSKLEINGRVSQVGVGDRNAFFGLNAGKSSNLANSLGQTAFGSGAGFSNVSGTQWLAIGFNAAYANIANNFVAIGHQSATVNTVGSGFSSIGFRAGFSNINGSNWFALGASSGLNNTSGSNWLCIGTDSGRYYSGGITNATSFSNGVYIGHLTKVGAAGATNEIVIGYLAEGDGSNTVVIGNSSIISNRLFGTLRVGTINNATGNFLTASATGVIQQRTAAQVLTDIGAQATIAGTQTNGFVATIVAGVPTWAATSGSVGAGAGLSIDGGGDIQLGDENAAGSRQILITDWEDLSSTENSLQIYREKFDSTNYLYNQTDIKTNFNPIGDYFESSFVNISYVEEGTSAFADSNIKAISILSGSTRLSVALAQLRADTERGGMQITLQNDDSLPYMIVVDGVNNKGLEEDADYSANKTDFSYVTKKMLTNVQFKLLDEDITPTAFTAATYTTILTGGILGTNSFDGSVDASYEGELWIRSVDDASSTFDLRFTIWGQNIDVNIVLGSGSQVWNTFVRFKIIVQGGNFLLNGQTISMIENTDFERVKNINHSMTTYTASSTSSLDIKARCLGTGIPTLYPTSFVLKQVL